MRLALWMAVTFLVHLLLNYVLLTATAKDLFLKTAYLAARLISNLSMLLPDGCATDAQVFKNARSRDLLIPEGKYFLADAGYPLCDQLLVPYRGVQYHLSEWGRAGVRPANKEELFNLRHASA